MNVPSLAGAKYFLLFKDDFSYFRTVYFLKHKSEAVDKLNIFLNLVENQFDRRVKVMKSDNGTEIKNARSRDIFEQLGIFHERSVSYTPQQNGRIEREMRTIVEAARAEIYAKDLGISLWAEALNYSVFTINQTGTSSVTGKSPADLWFGRRVSLHYMKSFGCEYYMMIPDHQRRKMNEKSKKGIFVGYDIEEHGYRIYFPDQRQVEVSCNVLFDEKIGIEKGYIEIDCELAGENESATSSESSSETKSNDDGNLQEERDRSSEIHDEQSESNQEASGSVPRYGLRNRQNIKPHPKYNDYVMIGEVQDISVRNALKDPRWKKAMQNEIESLKHMKTWELVNLPEGRKPLTCKWVFREKVDGRLKARIVARGFDQKPGIDYKETFAPVARHASICLLLSYAASEKLHIRTFDIKTAFLNGDLLEEIFIFQPEGFDDNSGRVCLLKKSLYGLKQAPKAWNDKFTNYLKRLKLDNTDDDPCIFYNETKSVIMGVFVDDGIIIGHDKSEIEEVLSKLARKFEITSENPNQGKLFYLGMEIHLIRNGILITQEKYTRGIVSRFGFEEAYPVKTPIEPGMLTKRKINDKALKNKPYREIVGSLLYLSTISRPDISFTVNFLSRQVSNPSVSHWKMIERVFRYLKGTEHFGIFFNGKAELKAYTDSNYGGVESDMISTSGVLIDHGGPIVGIAQKQSITSISSPEAEYRAAVTGIQELCWIRRMILELGMTDLTKPTDLFVDNKPTIHMLENAEEGKLTKGKKHIEIRRKFNNQHVGKTVHIVYINTKEQIADIFTKALSKGSFEKLRRKLLKEECWC